MLLKHFYRNGLATLTAALVLGWLGTCVGVANGQPVAPPATHVHMERLAGTMLGDVLHLIPQDQPLGHCASEPGHTEVRVTIPNIEPIAGNIRISLYAGNKKTWMKKGKKLIRFDVPVESTEMAICMPLPYGAGTYALGFYHDENANTDYDWPSEGYGFSNNARAKLFGPASYKKAKFEAGPGRTELAIRARY